VTAKTSTVANANNAYTEPLVTPSSAKMLAIVMSMVLGSPAWKSSRFEAEFVYRPVGLF
jgi:hypothetical protein